MHRTLLLVVVLLLPSAGVCAASGQQAPPPTLVVAAPGETQELVMVDGSKLYGRVERLEGDRVTFRTISGTSVEIDKAQIASLRRVEGHLVEGVFWKADPNPTRLFFGPTGRSIKAGEAYAGVYEIFLPFVQVGITDRISIGGGTPLVYMGGARRPFWITPKIQVLKTASTQAAIGAMHFLNLEDGSLGIAYGVVTQGSTDSAVSVGVGYGYERSGRSSNGAAVVMLAGEHRVSGGIKLVTENYIFKGGGIATAGARWFGERLSVDFGMVVPLGINEFVAFPIVNFVWQFSRR